MGAKPYLYLLVVTTIRFMESIIKVTHLTKVFKEITAVNDLSFTVQKADVYGFLGQNGAGKSTTIRMLLTLISASEGDIEIFGYDLLKHRKKILRNVGAVIERPDLYKYLTAYETLQLFAKMSEVKIGKQQLMEQLELVGLAQRAHSKVRTYSQGMKQRLGIAVALVHNPELIILDEPTNGLDPQGIADIRNLILMLSQKMNKTILVSSHLLNEIEQIANRMLIIDKGKKLVEGTVNELFSPDDTLIYLESRSNVICENVLRSNGYGSYITSFDAGGIVLKLRKEQVPALTKMLIENNTEILGITPRHSLEDYFLKITTANQHVEPFKN